MRAERSGGVASTASRFQDDTTCSADLSLPCPAFFRMRDVLRITGLSRPTLYRRIVARRFPPPIHLGGRACGWAHSALQAWIANPDTYLAPEAENRALPRRPRGRSRKYVT